MKPPVRRLGDRSLVFSVRRLRLPRGGKPTGPVCPRVAGSAGRASGDWMALLLPFGGILLLTLVLASAGLFASPSAITSAQAAASPRRAGRPSRRQPLVPSAGPDPTLRRDASFSFLL